MLGSQQMSRAFISGDTPGQEREGERRPRTPTWLCLGSCCAAGVPLETHPTGPQSHTGQASAAGPSAGCMGWDQLPSGSAEQKQAPDALSLALLSLLEKEVPWRLQGPEVTGLVWAGLRAHAGQPLSPGPSLSSGASCSWAGGSSVSSGPVTWRPGMLLGRKGEHPSRRLRAGRRPTYGGPASPRALSPSRAVTTRTRPLAPTPYHASPAHLSTRFVANLGTGKTSCPRKYPSTHSTWRSCTLKLWVEATWRAPAQCAFPCPSVGVQATR